MGIVGSNANFSYVVNGKNITLKEGKLLFQE